MREYEVELYGKNGSSKLDSTLLIDAKTIEKAAVEAVEKLKEDDFVIGYKEVWGAKILNPGGEDYLILEKGRWLIDVKTGKLKTGKKPDSLEGKLD
jgi:hypothetical protein